MTPVLIARYQACRVVYSSACSVVVMLYALRPTTTPYIGDTGAYTGSTGAKSRWTT